MGAAEVGTTLARDSLPVSHVTLSRKLKVRFQYLRSFLMEVKVMEEEKARGKQDVLWNLGRTAVQ